MPLERISPQLRAWCLDPEARGARTAVVRVSESIETSKAVESFEQRGIEITSAGPGAIIAVVTPATLRELAELDWVVAVEEPRRLFTRSPGMK